MCPIKICYIFLFIIKTLDFRNLTDILKIVFRLSFYKTDDL